eukprot:gene12251-biopygen11583
MEWSGMGWAAAAGRASKQKGQQQRGQAPRRGGTGGRGGAARGHDARIPPVGWLDRLPVGWPDPACWLAGPASSDLYPGCVGSWAHAGLAASNWPPLTRPAAVRRPPSSRGRQKVGRSVQTRVITLPQSTWDTAARCSAGATESLRPAGPRATPMPFLSLATLSLADGRPSRNFPSPEGFNQSIQLRGLPPPTAESHPPSTDTHFDGTTAASTEAKHERRGRHSGERGDSEHSGALRAAPAGADGRPRARAGNTLSLLLGH